MSLSKYSDFCAHVGMHVAVRTYGQVDDQAKLVIFWACSFHVERQHKYRLDARFK